MTSAAEVRSQVQAKRKALPAPEVQARSAQVCERFLKELPSLLDDLPQRRVGLYRALPEELSLQVLEKFFLQNGTQIYFPRVIRGEGRPKDLEFVKIPPRINPDSVMEVGAFGISEPSRDFPASPLKDLDLILVPGVVFGPNGERAGRGAGFYDRILPGLSDHCLRVALIFDFQLVEDLESNPWDQPVDLIIAESFQRERRGQAQFIKSAQGLR